MKLSLIRWPVVSLLGLALIATVPPAAAQAEDPEAYGDEYAAGDYGRLRFIDGGATILRAGGEDIDARAATNAPLFPGDRIQTGRGQRVEVELASGSIVRLADGSDLTLQSLPRPDAKFRDNTVLLLERGLLRVNVNLTGDDEFRVDTPAGSIYLLGDGDFRIEADGSGRTSVHSRRGVAEVVGEGGSVLVRGGSGTTLRAGTFPDDPQPFRASAGDSFDAWVEERDASIRDIEHHEASAMPAEELPAEVRPYYGELSAHGRWVSVPNYGWAWSPYSVAPGWRPYNDGYWSYGPSGYFWVGNEPWGWAPYRYGRWSWLDGYGWFWCPGRVFSGAWVSWSWGSLYVGWAPLNYWGYPAYIGAPYHYGHYNPHCWTFVDYHHIASRDVHRHAVPIARAESDVRGRPAVTRAPHIPPSRLATSREWRERAAREAAGDARTRVRTSGDSAAPATRSFRDVEARISRNARTASGRQAAAPRGDIRTRPAPSAAPSRATAPGRATAPSRVKPSEGSTAPDNRTAPGKRAGAGNRETRPSTGTVTRERSIAPPRSSLTEERGAQTRQLHQPLPRRYSADPRNDKGKQAAPPAREDAAPRDSGRRELAPRGTNERVRELYEQLSRTGEMRRAPSLAKPSDPSRAQSSDPSRAQSSDPSRAQPSDPSRAQPSDPSRAQPSEPSRRERVAPPRAQPSEPSRVQPSDPSRAKSSERSKPRNQGRPEARPAPSPRPAPARPAPQPKRAQGDSKRSRR